MSIFDINYNFLSIDLTSPDKRKPKFLILLQTLMGAIQWARDLILGSYKTGATAPNWSPGMYHKYDQVIYSKSLYMALLDTTTAPTDITNWQLILPNFLGVDERIKFNAQVCVLEMALNARFTGVFRMPPSATHSDIYISNIPAVISGFCVGQTTGSAVGRTTSDDTVGLPIPFEQVNGYQINVPLSIFSTTNESEIRSFVDQYNNAGINYLVVSY